MLKSINIENYALIEALEIQFDQGLSIITGETGAGKSILLGALSLLTGQRADSNVMKNPEKKCIVEAIFDLKNHNLNDFFVENDLEYEEQTSVRRIIAPGGKSRAFVNDAPVSLQQLKELAPKLIDIHSQHQNLLLADDKFQLGVVDSFAKNADLLEKYSEAYSHYRKAEKALRELTNRAETIKREYDYIAHQFGELDAANLHADEPTQLDEELDALTHAEDIKLVLTQIQQSLSGEAEGVLPILQANLGSLRKVTSFFPRAAEYLERIENAYYDLKDIADEAEQLGERTEYDPDRIQFVNQRLALYFDLQKKHRCLNAEELIALREKYRQELEEISNFDSDIEDLQKKLDSSQKKAQKLAEELTSKRRKSIPTIEKQIVAQLKLLGMPNAQLSIDQHTADSLQASGADEISFQFSANKNATLQPIAKVASGGEISRVMLSLKYFLGQHAQLPTIIFDEIDTGVSGDIADKMGNIMREMSGHMQVVSITHLPQVAAKGAAHFKVYKHDTAKGTSTQIKALSPDERTREIAQMLSGSQLTDAAIQNAKDLLGI